MLRVHGEWRSPAARSVRDAEVGGSNPLSPTIQGVAFTTPFLHPIWQRKIQVTMAWYRQTPAATTDSEKDVLSLDRLGL